MLPSTVLIPPSAAFWDDAARALLQSDALADSQQSGVRDLSSLRVVVSTFAHIQLLKSALGRQLGAAFIPPTITSLGEYIRLLPPQTGASATAPSERLMSLYADLRQHAWLKKLFSARRNTDLLPLAEILLALSDELTQEMLPELQVSTDVADARWQAALEQLSPVARNLLSDETQLVWTIWKSQLDASDAIVHRFAQMMRIAEQAHLPLFWISPVEADALEQAFLDAYQVKRPVVAITLDWHAQHINSTYAAAWPELLADEDVAAGAGLPLATPAGLSLYAAHNLEAEAKAGAQTILDWLQQGKTNLAIVAQDRVVARRIRALLERAQVVVADETGWKLSTTRAAAALASWLELVAARAETIALLDFLKSPFVFANTDNKADLVMASELALRRANVLGGWDIVGDALTAIPAAQNMVKLLAQQATGFSKGKTLCDWITASQQTLDALGMRAALQADGAGAQVLQLLQDIEQDCTAVGHVFSFAEWRAFLNLQLEATAYVQLNRDRRVVMLPLNGARLRSFDAVLLVGADAEHLPSQPSETLFFANVVRRELGLATRESRQRQQLRDVTELLSSNEQVVMSWQAHKNGEPNPVSPWIERLQLSLARAGLPEVATHQVVIAPRSLIPAPLSMPAPHAAVLRPQKLSASGYNSLVACPYQFFATRMLGLSGLDELSDMPEKRDYGDWLHQILAIFHTRLHEVAQAERAGLLQEITDQVFNLALDKSASALGYYARWQKAMPAYLEWLSEREAQGWHFVLGEEKFEKVLRWDDGEIILHGRVDRMDENASGERAVLDYKSTNQIALREKLKQGEDHQLPFYGLLSDVPLTNALYIPLEASKDKIKEVESPDYDNWQQTLSTQIVNSMRAIAHDAPLPATGPESVCQYCDVRGLCRKGAW